MTRKQRELIEQLLSELGWSVQRGLAECDVRVPCRADEPGAMAGLFGGGHERIANSLGELDVPRATQLIGGLLERKHGSGRSA